MADPNPNPGAFLLARHGSDERFGAAGVADRSAGTPMAPDLRFRTGSVTKTFTATVVLQLVAHTNWSSLADTGIDDDFWAAFQQGYCRTSGQTGMPAAH
ncbi:serine hydrolase [Streptomyces sp. MH13]|uniref:serine hydrolase n=1 Tax=unclassified Streptomyces TaxID=2593676 RepID=UPI003CF4B68B